MIRQQLLIISHTSYATINCSLHISVCSSNDELQSLIDCEDATLDRQFSDGAAARAMERCRNQLLEENRRIARENIEKKARFFELRNQLLQRYHDAKQLKAEVETLQEEAPHGNHAAPSLDTIQALLEAAAREAEDESEVKHDADIFHSYSGVTSSMDDFVKYKYYIIKRHTQYIW